MEDEHTFFETMSFWFKHPEYNINLAFIETYPGCGYYLEMVKKGIDRRQFMLKDNWHVNHTKLSDDAWDWFKFGINILTYYYHPEGRLGTLVRAYP